ncbi:MAG: hypothetical protein P4L35_08200 [Ignavibacteriaceae bacterium]|nr:hypothetical protein [Ignavibacteriaceae bacterium]
MDNGSSIPSQPTKTSGYEFNMFSWSLILDAACPFVKSINLAS